MVVNTLAFLMIALPVAALVLDLFAAPQVAERHHRHHDTYSVPRVLLASLVVVMLFMGALGLILGWLCVMHVFPTSVMTVLAFFTSFVVVVFLQWLFMRRYKVVIYGDRMKVTPPAGRSLTVRFADITSMQWKYSWLPGTSRRLLKVTCADGSSITLWGAVDLDQILMSIDRFDVLQ